MSFIDFHSRIATSLQFETTDFIITWEDDDGEFVSIRRAARQDKIQ